MTAVTSALAIGVVRVEGFSGISEGESALGQPLFPAHQFKTDIPEAPKHVLDIVVPN